MKIPIVTATTDIPTSIPGSESAGMEWGAARGLGHNLQGLALQISEEGRQIRERLQEGANLIFLNKKIGEMADFDQEVSNKLDGDPSIDPMDRKGAYVIAANEKKEELLKGITDPVLKDRLENALTKNINISSIDQGQIGIRKKHDQVDAGFREQAFNAFLAGDLKTFNEIGDMAVKTGIWTEVFRGDLKKKIEIQAKEVKTRNEIGGATISILDNPENWLSLSTEEKQKQYPNLLLDDIARLNEKAQAKINQEGTRLDKLTQVYQRENQAEAIDNFANGSLSLDKLNALRVTDPETGRPGLSDQFYVTWRDRLISGKDVSTNPKTFNELYLDENLDLEKIDAKAGEISGPDQRILLGIIRQERKAEESEAKYYKRQGESDKKREARLAASELLREKRGEESELKREARREESEIKAEARRQENEEKSNKKREEAAANFIRNKYASDAKSYLKKAFGEYGVNPEKGIDILKAFEGYYANKEVKDEDLIEYAKKLMEKERQGVISRLFEWLTTPPVPKPDISSPAGFPAITNRKSLNEIFGTK